MRMFVIILSILSLFTTGLFAQENSAIQAITIDPGDTTVAIGQTVQFTATVIDTAGATVDSTVTWAVLDTSIGSIDSVGLFSTLSAGSTNIVAMLGEITDTASVTVTTSQDSSVLVVIGSIEINPADTTVTVGDSVLFQTSVLDTTGNSVDTTVSWTVTDTTIGSIDSTGLFTGLLGGTTNIIATLGEVTDTASVTVAEIPVVLDSIEISPGEKTIAPGDSLQFQAEVFDSSGVLVDTSVVWAVADSTIGTIDSTGLFIALTVGSTQVTASIGEIIDSASITVEVDAPPVGGGNTVTFKRIGKNNKVTNFGKSIQEGETKTLGGMPHPLNFLNGGKLFFPENSLSQNITITIKLPGFSNDPGERSGDVTFGDSIAAAVAFEVSINDSVISPFEFDVPLQLTLPFKRGLLTNLGIDPLNLGMFFVSDSGLVGSGITNVFVDSAANTIVGTVSHFSDIAVARKPKSSAPVAVGGGRIDINNSPVLSNLGLNSLFIDIPSGALQNSVNIEVTIPTSIPTTKAAFQAVEFNIEGASGQFNFDIPVTVGIPYPDNVTNEANLSVALWNPSTQDWEPIELLGSITLDTNAKIVNFQVNHFSIYGVLDADVITDVEDDTIPLIPSGYTLTQNYPNPFNPNTTIEYFVPVTSNVSITIYNLLGQEVRTLTNSLHVSGKHQLLWDGRSNTGHQVGSGIYIYRLKAGNKVQSKRMILIK